MYFFLSAVVLVLHVASAANILFESATVISFDQQSQSVLPLYNTSLLVKDDKIESIFPASQPIDLPADVERIPSQGKILTPGFIDTHRHLWQSALRTLGSNTSLAEYYALFSEFSAQQTTYTPEDVYLSQLVGIWESFNAGVTSILDHAHSTWSPETSSASLKATIDSGGRVWWCYAIHDLNTTFTLDDQFEDFRNLSNAKSFANTTTSMGLAWDGWTISTPELNQRIVDLANSQNVSAFTTHFLGGPWAIGNSPTVLHSYDFLNTSVPIVFSHAAFTNPQDADLLRSTNQYISITPESEEHYGQGHEHNHLIQDQASLGVDTHFTYSADIVTQARIWMQSVRYKLYAATLDKWKVPLHDPMSVQQSFLLATRGGALALKRDDIGVLLPGAKADIVVFNASGVHLWGWSDPVATVMLHSNVGDVEHVLVNGEFRKRDFALAVDPEMERDVRARFLESALRIQRAFRERAYPDLGPDFSSGYPFDDVASLDVVRGDGTGYDYSNRTSLN